MRRSWAVVGLCFALLRCGDSSGPDLSVAGLIAGVSVAGSPSVAATLNPDSFAVAGVGLFVAGGQTVINGGSAQFRLSAASPFRFIGVGVSGRPGHYFLALPAPVDSVDLILALATALPSSQFDLAFIVADDSTIVGDGLHTVIPLQVGSGDIQVSVSWDTDSDVDLHLVEPGAEEIYYGNDSSASGGVLDLDSNAGCSIDGVRNENITWPSATPPSGTYTVRVDYWSSCSQAQTSYVVTVHVKGHATQSFTGSFTGPGDQGGGGSGATVTTFAFP